MTAPTTSANIQIPSPSWKWSRWQVPVWNSKAANKVLACGFGAGKDIVCIRCAIRDCFEILAKKRKVIAENGPGADAFKECSPLVMFWVLAPKDELLGQIKRDVILALDSIARDAGMEPRQLYTKQVRRADRIVLLDGGIEIEFRSAFKPDNLRGPGVDVMICTEAAFPDDAIWPILDGRMTRAGRMRRWYVNSTPHPELGKSTKFYQFYLRGENDELSNWQSFHATSLDNDFLTEDQKDEIRSEQKIDPHKYTVERLAEFVSSRSGQNALHPPDLCLISKPRGSDGPYVVGTDFARFGPDATAFAVIDLRSGEIVELQRHAKLNGPGTVEIMVDLDSRYGHPVFRVDTNGFAGSISDFAHKAGLRVKDEKFSRQYKEVMIRRMNDMIATRRIAIPDPYLFPFEEAHGLDRGHQLRENVKILLREWTALRMIVSAKGIVQYQPPAGEHDDVVDATMMAMMEVAALDAKPVPDHEAIEGGLAKLQAMFG